MPVAIDPVPGHLDNGRVNLRPACPRALLVIAATLIAGACALGAQSTTVATTGQRATLPPVVAIPQVASTRAAPSAATPYVFPVFGSGAAFSSDYGAPRGGTGWHHGNDIFAPIGVPVLAVADGVLSKVGVNTLGGNRLWLTDDLGNAYYYAHLSGYANGVTDGVRVRGGEIIGFVGNTGQAITTPPHLHFEIHPGDGVSVDPYPYLLAWRRGTSVSLGFSAAVVAHGQAPAVGAVLVGEESRIETPAGTGDGMAQAVP